MISSELDMKSLQNEYSDVKLDDQYETSSEPQASTDDTCRASHIVQTPTVRPSKSLILNDPRPEKSLVKNDFFRTSYPSLNAIISHVDTVITRIKPIHFEPPSYLDGSLLKPGAVVELTEPHNAQALRETTPKSFFASIRDHLVRFQVSQNIPHEPYNFISLLTTLCALGCNAIQCIFLIITALLPMLEILIHISRFLVDRGLDIVNTRSRQERLRRWFIFGVEASIVFCLVIFITSSVLLPLGSLSILILYKIMTFFFAL